MFQNIDRVSDQVWVDKLVALKQSAKALTTMVCELAVQALLHYHESNRDVSRCQQFDLCLDEAGLGRHQAAFRKILRSATAITGIGSETWKGGKESDLPEDWEEHVERLVEGGGAVFMTYAEAPKKAEKKGKKKTPTLKLEGASETVVNAAQKAFDAIAEMPEEDQLRMIRAIESGKVEAAPSALDQVQNDTLREALEAYIVMVNSLASVDMDTAIAAVQRGCKAVRRHIDSSVNDLKKAAVEAAAAVQDVAA